MPKPLAKRLLSDKHQSVLEDQLAHVVERDGVPIVSPRGVRRRAARSSWVTRQTSDKPRVAQDEIAALDHVGASHVIEFTRDIPVHTIPVQQGEHRASAFVISLRDTSFGHLDESTVFRAPIAEVFTATQTLGEARPVETYATLRADLLVDVDPRFISEQYTPEHFQDAYTEVYGRMHTWRDRFTGAWEEFLTLFQRVEQLEERMVEAAEEATIEIREVPRFSFARAVVGFASLALIVTLPAHAISIYRFVATERSAATGAGREALGNLLSAANASSPLSSAEALAKASNRFREADDALREANTLALGIASFVPNQLRSARSLLEAGDKASQAGRLMALGLDTLLTPSDRHYDERFEVLSSHAQNASLLLADANRALATVRLTDVPEPERAQVAVLKDRLQEAEQVVRDITGISDLFVSLLGKEHLRKYLVIFQNQTELRPTGGFMGSFAEITIDRGKITSIRIPPGGTYDLKGQLTERVLPPEPLRLIANRWQFQDANWSPDFVTAAHKINWFWDKSGQSSVDGIITVNASVLEDLLKITGPIDLPAYGKTIDADNVLLETQKAVEVEYDKVANTPKKFLGDLLEVLMARTKTFSKDEWLRVVEMGAQALDTKDIQIALNREAEEQVIERYGWSGRLKETPGDMLALIEANIAGQKTDGVIKEDVTHEARINEAGVIEDTVTLTRTHEGIKGEPFRGVRNVSYLRVYVPKGSVLRTSSGFSAPSSTLFKEPDSDSQTDPDVHSLAWDTASDTAVPGGDEGGYTVFGGWLQLDPGETQTIVLTYRLPFTVSELLQTLDPNPQSGAEAEPSRGAYTLLLTSQSGKTNRTITSRVQYPAGWDLAWSRLEGSKEAGLVSMTERWDRDRVVAHLFHFSHDQNATP